MAKLVWHGDRVVRAVEKEMDGRMDKACIELQNKIKNVLKASTHSGRTYRVPGTKQPYTASAPGEAPAIVTSRIFNAITYEVKKEGKEIIGRVGVALGDEKYPLALELGFVHKKSGKKIPPRPYLRPALEASWRKIKSILGAR